MTLRKILVSYLLAILILFCLSVVGHAQTFHTFSFGPLPIGGTDSSPAPFTLIDGQTPNQFTGPWGEIQIRGSGEWWGMIAPASPCNPVCGWGFPNNGYLLQNTTVPNPGQLIFDNPGCGPRIVGCTSHSTTTVPFQDYGAGVTVTVTTTYIVQKAPCQPRYCDNNDADDYNNVSTGGTGTAIYQVP